MAKQPYKSAPDSAFYGAFPTALAQSMASSGDATDRIVMLHKARQAQAAYEAALGQSQQAEYLQNHDENQSNVATHYLDQLANLQKAGISGAVQADTGGYINADQGTLEQAGQVGLDNQVAEGLKNRGAGIKDIESATGYVPDKKVVSDYLIGPLGQHPDMMKAAGPSGNSIDLIKANAAEHQAQAHMVDAQRPRSSGNGGGDSETITETLDPDGNVLSTTRKAVSKGGHADTGGQPAAANGKVKIQMRGTNQVKMVSKAVADHLVSTKAASKVE